MYNNDQGYLKSRRVIKLTPMLLFSILISSVLIGRLYRGFYSSGFGGYWNYIELLFIGIGFFFILSSYSVVSKEKSIWALFTFSLYALVMSFIRLQAFSVNSVYEVLIIPYAAMIAVVFYVESLKYDFSEYGKILIVLYYALAVLSIVAISRTRAGILEKGDGANTYYVLGLAPIVIAKTKKHKIIPVLTVFVAIALTGKRAGFIAAILLVVVYFFVQATIENNVKQKTKTILLMVFGGIVLYFVIRALINYYDLNVIERLSKLGTDGGSGRDVRWEYTIGLLKESSFFQIVFGHGVSFEAFTHGLHVHNDFLEVLYNYGIIGEFCYVSFYIYLIVEGVRMIKARFPYSGAFAASIVVSLCLAMFSFYIIDDSYIACGALCYGIILGYWRRWSQQTIGYM